MKVGVWELVAGPRFVKGKLQLMMPWRLERACSSLLLQDKGSARNTLDTLDTEPRTSCCEGRSACVWRVDWLQSAVLAVQSTVQCTELNWEVRKIYVICSCS